MTSIFLADTIICMDRAPIEVGNFVHVYNRGVDKRDIFLDEEDRARFYFYLGVLNHDQSVPTRAATAPIRWCQGSTLTNCVNEAFREQSPLVGLCAFALMTNHIHLVLREVRPGGVSKYMQRLSTAFTMFFNEKRERTGALFQGRFKSRIVEDEGYLWTLLNYVHCNPLDMLKNKNKSVHSSASEMLASYFWSSYAAYDDSSGVKLDFVSRKAVEEALGELGDYRDIINGYAPADAEEALSAADLLFNE